MVWYGWVVVHHVRMHRACESSFSVLLLLVHHNVFEILLCAYYSEREKEREREGWLEQVKVYSNRLGISRVKRVVRLQLGGVRTCLPIHKKPWLT